MFQGKRVTLDEVVAAYDATGIKPARGAWECGGWACGLGVLAIQKSFTKFLKEHDETCWTTYTVAKYLDLDVNYAEGFVFGFDNNISQPPPETEATLAGQEDGNNIAQHFFTDNKYVPCS